MNFNQLNSQTAAVKVIDLRHDLKANQAQLILVPEYGASSDVSGQTFRLTFPTCRVVSWVDGGRLNHQSGVEFVSWEEVSDPEQITKIIQQTQVPSLGSEDKAMGFNPDQHHCYLFQNLFGDSLVIVAGEVEIKVD